MHKIVPYHLRFLVWAAVATLCGCWLTQQPQGAGSPPAELLLKGVSGPRKLAEPSATWIRDPSTLSALYRTFQEHLGAENIDAPHVDFDTYGVLLLEMGQKPTGGFAVDFNPAQTRMDDGQLVVCVSWDTPARGMTVTQAVTSPFIMLKINATGTTAVRVLNQNSQTLFEVPVE